MLEIFRETGGFSLLRRHIHFIRSLTVTIFLITPGPGSIAQAYTQKLF